MAETATVSPHGFFPVQSPSKRDLPPTLDRSKITLRNGRVVTTTCLEVGEFEIVAVNLFAIDDTWRFAFALNNDLPRTKSKKYAKRVRPFLLATLPKITWPQHYPYVSDPFVLMNLLLAGQKSLPKPVLTS